ncbi:MAG: phosphoadenosine phosphosulfate reductase family protein [Planctomycetota bacterium]
MNQKTINRHLKESFSRQVVQRIVDSVDSVVMSSSFGRYSAVMLHLVHSECGGCPVINIKLGDETAETERHRKRMQDKLDLDLRLYSRQEGESKADTFERALDNLNADALLSGLLWEETDHRKQFEYVMFDRDSDIYRVHPVLHWRHSDQEAYCRKYELPVNRDYYDPHKEESEKKECGIHVFDYEQDGSGI